MSKLDEKYILNLQNLSDALESLVDILKEQHKAGGQAGGTDTVNTMLGNMDTEKFNKIVDDLNDVKATSIRIENNTDKILKEVKDARSAKESGMFGEIEDPKNKSKIVDGIKVVALIAGGVLAIGLAFKIIGNVDFLSVIGLSVAMLIMAKTYSEMSNMKGMNWKNVLIINLMLVTMSIALLASSVILNQMPDLSPKQLITAIALGITMGIVSWGLLKGIGSFDPKNMWMIAIIPVLIPAVAGGILLAALIFTKLPALSFSQLLTAIFVGVALIPISFAFSLMAKGLKGADWKSVLFTSLAVPVMASTIVGASYLFQKMQDVTFNQMLSGVFVGIALIPIAFAFALVAKGLKGADWKTMLFTSLAIPVIAGALVAASVILQGLQPVEDPVGMILTSIAIGVSVLALVPAFFLISKMKMDMKSMLMGALTIIVVSGVIMISSQILALGKYDNYPSVDWAAGVGLSMLSFVPAVVILGLIATSGVGLVAIGLGLLSVIGVAAAMLAVSYILGMGKWDNFPSVDWAKGVGLSMLAFIVPMIALGTLIMATFGIGGLLLLAGAGAIMGIVSLMVDISNVFSSNSFDSYPSVDWVKGVTGALNSFGSFITNMPVGIFDMLKVLLLGRAIVNIAKLFNKNANLFNEPNVAWVDNIKNILDVFQLLPDKDKADGLNAITNSLNRMAMLGAANIIPILLLAGTIRRLNSALDELNEKNVDKLTQLSKGVMILSIIDDSKLADVIETLNDKKRELSTVFDEKGSSFIQDILNAKNAGVSTSPIGGSNTVNAQKSTEPEEDRSVIILQEISDKIDTLITKMEKVEKASNVGTSLGID
jgi:hypothetical protein